MSKLIVRPARGSDYRALEKIIRDSFDYWDQRWALEGLRYTYVIVAELRGDVVGFAELYSAYVAGLGGVGVIYYLAVLSGYRRMGVGSALVKAAEDIFAKWGLEYSAASTRLENVASRGLFLKLGYREIPAFKAYDLVHALYAYEDDVIFLKPLKGREPGDRA